MNLMFRKKDTIKNSISEETELPTNMDALNRWTIPKVGTSLIYQLGTFEKIGLKQVVKTTEESITLENDESVINLLTENDIGRYRNLYKFIHIGLVQIAFKPLTLKGLPESFIAALRDGRNLNWNNSIMGIIQSSLAHGPIYFNVYPDLNLSLSDINILESLTLHVKTNGYTYAEGSELICLCYRIYYKPLFTLNPNCRIKDKNNNETILIESNYNQSNITTRRRIKWDEIPIPENWKLEKTGIVQPQIESEVRNIIQTSEGIVNIQMNNKNMILGRKSCSSIKSRLKSQSNRYYLSPYIEDIGTSSQNLNEEEIDEELIHINNVIKNKENIVKGVYNIKDADITESEMNFSL